jgi:hypothetical protein
MRSLLKSQRLIDESQRLINESQKIVCKYQRLIQEVAIFINQQLTAVLGLSLPPLFCDYGTCCQNSCQQ